VIAGCPFCLLDASRKWIENEHAIAFSNAYPVTKGHYLIIPRRLVSSIYELSTDEQATVWKLVADVRERLLTGLKPNAFNIGINDGRAAGQTVDHAPMCTSSHGQR
jgi:diadenosine tetraphosphate (Ap4A) HIT family hydrolase